MKANIAGSVVCFFVISGISLAHITRASAEASGPDSNTKLAPRDCHTSTVGEKFCRDRSNPSVGVAYRNSGLIWTEPQRRYTPSGEVELTMSWGNAQALCYTKESGFHLPSADEFEDLARALGKGSSGGFTVYGNDGKEVLPGFFDGGRWWFWTQTAISTPYYNQIFETRTGQFRVNVVQAYAGLPVAYAICVKRVH